MSSDPSACNRYDWSFCGPKDVVVICLWHNNLGISNEHIIFQNIDFNHLENITKGGRFGRCLKMREAVENTFYKKLQLRVVIGLTLDGSYKTVDKRVLDPVPWRVENFDINTGNCTLKRGIC